MLTLRSLHTRDNPALLARIDALESRLRTLFAASNEKRTQLLGEYFAELDSGAIDQLRLSDTNTSQDRELALEDSPVCVDSDGEVVYYGSTSRFYLPAKRSEARQVDVVSKTECVKANIALQKSWERLAYAKLKYDAEVPSELTLTLLEMYWQWQHPLHMAVYKPCKSFHLIGYNSQHRLPAGYGSWRPLLLPAPAEHDIRTRCASCRQK
jgi:hypothetical protein